MTSLRALATLVAVHIAGCAPSSNSPAPAPTPTPAPTPPAPGPVNSPTSTATAPAPAELALRVNGEPVTRSAFIAEVDRHMARYHAGGHQLPASIEMRVRKAVLERTIENTLVAQKARTLGLEVSDTELDAAFAEHKARFRTAEAFADYLKRSHNTEADMRADLFRHLLRDRVVAQLAGRVDVTEQEVRSYFDENRARFREREMVEANRILIRCARDAPGDQASAARDLARKLHRQALSSPRRTTFADLARQHSHAPEASRGGDLGWLTRGRMPPAWDQVAFTLEPGQISKPIRTDNGFEIIAVWDRRPERDRSFEEVVESIRSSLTARKRNEKRSEILHDLRAEADVEILVELEAEPSEPAPK